MKILEDTRQQESKHGLKHKYFIQNGIYWDRTCLYCGDYTFPTDHSICVDTKKDIQELIGDIQVKKMPKREINNAVLSLADKYSFSSELAGLFYHAVTDDDEKRFPEGEINDIGFKNGIPEGCISAVQKLYIKRHGFFHRDLKRAQNNDIKLYILIANEEGVRSIRDVSVWTNPRIKKSPVAMKGGTLAKAMLTMEAKYGVSFRFCRPEDAGEHVIKLLTKQME